MIFVGSLATGAIFTLPTDEERPSAYHAELPTAKDEISMIDRSTVDPVPAAAVKKNCIRVKSVRSQLSVIVVDELTSVGVDGAYSVTLACLN